MTPPIEWRFQPCPQGAAVFPAEWQELVDRYCASNPALDARFMRLLAKYYGNGEEIIAIGYRGNVPAAAAILAPAGIGRWSLFQPGQACLSPFVHAVDLDLAGLLPSLMNALPSRCWRLRVPKVDPLYQATGTLDSLLFDSAQYGETFLIDLAGSFDDYWNARKKRLRQNARRWFRHLEQYGFESRLESLTQPGAMATAVAVHGRLESAGWKGEHGSAIGAENRQGEFYRELLSEFAADGNAVTWQLYVDDVPAASLLGIVGGGVIVILKTAHNEKLRDCSPGRIIDYLVLQECFAAGRFRAMDMYTRASVTDLAWSTASRGILAIDAYAKPTLRRAAKLVRRLRVRGG